MKRFLPGLALTLVIFLAGCDNYGTKVEYNGAEIYHTNKVTKADADALGQFLTNEKYFDGTKRSVQLDKNDAGAFLVRMVIKPEFMDNTGVQRSFALMAVRASKSVFNNTPVIVHLCTDRLKTVHEVTPEYQLEIFNKGEIFFKEPVTADEVKRLGEKLVELQLFHGKHVSTIIEKTAEGTYQLKLSINKDVLNKNEFIANMEDLGARIAREVFKTGQFEIHLCDTDFTVLKVVVKK